MKTLKWVAVVVIFLLVILYVAESRRCLHGMQWMRFVAGGAERYEKECMRPSVIFKYSLKTLIKEPANPFWDGLTDPPGV